MRRTDRLTIIISLLLFLAFLAYAGVYVFRALGSTTVTAEAVAAEIELSGVASGIVIREETVLTSAERYVDVTAAEGAKVAAGSVLATAVSSEQGLARSNRMHELEREISRVSAVLREMRSADDLTTREASLTGAARLLASAVARHEAGALDSATLNLEALLLGAEDETISAAGLDALERELESLKTSTTGDAVTLTTAKAGVFSSYVDGYEHLSYDDIRDLTPSVLQELIDGGREAVPAGAYGKLVSDYRWYFAAVMSTVDAANLIPGRTATLNFGRWYSADIYARVLSVSPSEDGAVVVVFRCDTALADTLSMRSAAASVVFGTYSGIRVPAQAVQTDPETEGTFVWTVTAMQLERKEIEIVYAAEDFVIARRGTDPGALREGNTVVVSGKDLYEGKIME